MRLGKTNDQSNGRDTQSHCSASAQERAHHVVRCLRVKDADVYGRTGRRHLLRDAAHHLPLSRSRPPSLSRYARRRVAHLRGVFTFCGGSQVVGVVMDGAATPTLAIPRLSPSEPRTVVAPAPAAATMCPPRDFASITNLAANPSFETVAPKGPSTGWHLNNPLPAHSAARRWLMPTDNTGSAIASRLISTTVPGPGGARMLQFRAGGHEGGIVQELPSAPAKLMFSAWVFVRRGRVVLQPHGGTQGPAAWSTKRNQWEQLRVCTDGSVPTGFFTIYNQDPAGGEFFVDRVEIRETP